MIKINLHAGPGSGKTAVANFLFGLLKMKSFSCETVKEYAKELVYDGVDLTKAEDYIQLKIFTEQFIRERLVQKGGISFMITDSPLLLNAFYSKNPYIEQMALSENKATDYHFWIERLEDTSFEQEGRSHNEEQSKKIDGDLKQYLLNNNIKLIDINGTDSLDKARKIYSIIQPKGRKTNE